jgi:DNA-directed RNA polymerase specialized sigma24 family protein
MKLTKTKKNQHPKLYGYGSLEQLQSDPENTQTHWVLYKDADGDLRFIPCDEEYFHFHRNDVRNERRRRDTESRCLIPSEKFGLVKCRADCSLCPKVRDGLPISIDYMRENYDFDFKDDFYEEHEEQLKEQEQSDFIWSLVSEFNETDQLILKYFNEGKTDAEIATELNKARSTIQERKTKLIKMLTEKYEKNKK